MKNQYFNRDILPKIIRYLSRREILAIIGPRQAGKTTLLELIKNHLIKTETPSQHIHTITLEDPGIISHLKTDPRDFVLTLADSLKPKDRHYILIDEFQYLEQGGQILKLLFDTTTNIKFIITGSSSLELRTTTGKWLVGRILYFYLWPLSFKEFLKTKIPGPAKLYDSLYTQLHRFIFKPDSHLPSIKTPLPSYLSDINYAFRSFIRYGGYPEVAKATDSTEKTDLLRGIYNTYIQKDIITLLKETDTEKYYHLIKKLAQDSGSLINYNDLCQDTGVSFEAIKKRLNVLEETFILKKLKPFYKNLSSELRKNPIAYLFDTGIRNYLIEDMSPLKDRLDKGALVENFVFTELIKHKPELARVNYWRTTGKAEVDFILRTGSNIIPVEVKYQSFSRSTLTRSFQSFLSTYQPRRALVLTRDYWGERQVNSTTVWFVPVWLI